MTELRALILDGEEKRVIRISGTLAEDDYSVLLLLSDYSDDPRSSYAERRQRRTIVLDLVDLDIEAEDEEHHASNHASNCLIVEIGHRALRGQWFELRGWNAVMRGRVSELFDAFGLEPPVLH